MKLFDTDITRFQALYKAHVGVELDHQAAREELAKLVRQVEIVYRPVTKEQTEALKRKDKENDSRMGKSADQE